MKATEFSQKVAQWYREHHRLLPWRETRDPYKIWLSEIILQQTRVAQGLPYYRAFIRKYPNVKALAAASEQEVLRLWQGLGYYTRARNLLACARMIVDERGGRFPRTYHELRQLKGIGDYTAAAIASFAFGEHVAVLDGNVFRVLARVFGLHDDVASTSGKKKFRELANSLVPAEDPATHNQAIMEFGALMCTPKSPSCQDCPIVRSCQAYRRGLQEELPVTRKPTAARHRYFHYLVFKRGNTVLMNQRVESDIWRGLWDFPCWESDAPVHEAGIRRKVRSWIGKEGDLQISREFRHILSHQIIHARFVEVARDSRDALPKGAIFSKAKCCTLGKLKQLPKPVLVARFLEELGLEG